MWEIKKWEAMLDEDGQIKQDEYVRGFKPADFLYDGWEPFSIEPLLYDQGMIRIWYRRQN